MTEEVAHEDSIRGTSDKAAGRVPQPVQANRPQPGRVARTLVAAAQSRAVQAPPEPIRQHVVIRLIASSRCLPQLLRRSRGSDRAKSSLLAFAVLVALWVRWAWRDRRVDFVHQIALGLQAEAAGAEVFDRVIPVLVRDGYAMVARGGNTTVFERRFFPAWTILVAFFLFPFGLVALLARGRGTVVIVSGDRAMQLHGSCPRGIADFIVSVADEVAAPSAYFR